MTSTTTRKNSGRRGGRTAADTTAADTTAADTTAAEAADGAEGVESAAQEAVVEADESSPWADSSWADAVPWLAVQMGSRPTGGEVAIAGAVWNLVRRSPGTTALRMAADAEADGIALDPSAVGRVLTRYARAGIVTAVEDGPVTRWSPVTPGELITATIRSATASATSTTSGLSVGAGGPRAVVGGGSRPAGELRPAVAAHLAAHAGEEFTPTELGHALGGRSSGAILNACERLVANGDAVQTSQRPRRFQHAATTAATVDPADATDEADEGPGRSADAVVNEEQ